MVIMPLYGHVYLISICKLDVICINSEFRHVRDWITIPCNVFTTLIFKDSSDPQPPLLNEKTRFHEKLYSKIKLEKIL